MERERVKKAKQGMRVVDVGVRLGRGKKWEQGMKYIIKYRVRPNNQPSGEKMTKLSHEVQYYFLYFDAVAKAEYFGW